MSVSSKEQTNQKLLIIVFEPNLTLAIRKLTSELQSIGDCTWQIIALGYLPFTKLSEKGVLCRNIDTYFVEEDHYYDYRQAIEISNQWFLDSEGSDSTVYHGISIGVILQVWAIQFFNNFLSNVRTAERVLKEENPDEIWLCFSKSRKDGTSVDDIRVVAEIFSALAETKNIVCTKRILGGVYQRKEPNSNDKNIFQKCKILLYSLIGNRLLFFTKYYLLLRKSSRIVNIMLPSPQTLNYMGRAVIDEFLENKKRNVLVWGGETMRQRINLIDISPPLRGRVKQYAREVSVRIEKQFIDFFERTKVRELRNTSNILKKVYKRQMEPSIEGIISDVEQLESCFSTKNIQAVLSHTDMAIRERTVISVANNYKVPSVVLQHGVAGHYWGFFPLIATKIAVWGEIIEKWFERNGVAKERVCVTGAANFDSYMQQIKNSKNNGKKEWRGISDYLLYITVNGKNFSTGFKLTRQDNELLLKTILDALETMPKKVLVIKLKPGDPQTEFYRHEIEKRSLKNVYLIDVTENKKLLSACGVLLTTYSTMAIEALFFRRPVIQLKFSNKKKLMNALYNQGILCDEDGIPLEKYGVALGVEKPEELRETIMKIYEDKNLRQSMIDKGKVFLREYTYEPDGKASLRVLQYIDQLIQQGLS